jgi:hypothetical protein
MGNGYFLNILSIDMNCECLGCNRVMPSQSTLPPSHTATPISRSILLRFNSFKSHSHRHINPQPQPHCHTATSATATATLPRTTSSLPEHLMTLANEARLIPSPTATQPHCHTHNSVNNAPIQLIQKPQPPPHQPTATAALPHYSHCHTATHDIVIPRALDDLGKRGQVDTEGVGAVAPVKVESVLAQLDGNETKAEK